MKRVFLRELANLVSGIFATLILLAILFIWRMVDSEWFLFLQITIATTLLYICLLSLLGKYRIFQNRELVATLIAFTIVGTLFLNVDRSRSFFLLKWVGQYSVNGSTTLEKIIAEKKFDSNQENALRQRIKEQGESVTLSIEGNEVRLTPLGKIIVRISNLLAQTFRLTGYIDA